MDVKKWVIWHKLCFWKARIETFIPPAKYTKTLDVTCNIYKHENSER